MQGKKTNLNEYDFFIYIDEEGHQRLGKIPHVNFVPAETNPNSKK